MSSIRARGDRRNLSRDLDELHILSEEVRDVVEDAVTRSEREVAVLFAQMLSDHIKGIIQKYAEPAVIHLD